MVLSTVFTVINGSIYSN